MKPVNIARNGVQFRLLPPIADRGLSADVAKLPSPGAGPAPTPVKWRNRTCPLPGIGNASPAKLGLMRLAGIRDKMKHGRYSKAAKIGRQKYRTRGERSAISLGFATWLATTTKSAARWRLGLKSEYLRGFACRCEDSPEPALFRLLESLMRHSATVVPRNVLAQSVWDSDVDLGDNLIDVSISQLRKNVDRDHNVKLIKTIRNLGYTIWDQSKTS